VRLWNALPDDLGKEPGSGVAVKHRNLMLAHAGEVEALRVALVEAVAQAALTGNTMNVTYGEDGFDVSVFVPAREYRREWIRVRCDGRIENGNDKKIIGTAKELGL
jgi:hypothetical protein